MPHMFVVAGRQPVGWGWGGGGAGEVGVVGRRRSAWGGGRRSARPHRRVNPVPPSAEETAQQEGFQPGIRRCALGAL